MSASLLRRHRLETCVIGRDLEHPDAGTVLRWREADACLGRLGGGSVDACGRFARVPDLVEERAVSATDSLDARWRSVFLNDSVAAGVVARDDAANGSQGHVQSPLIDA